MTPRSLSLVALAAVAGSIVLAQTRSADAQTITLYGEAPALQGGTSAELEFRFKDYRTDEVIHTARAEARIRDGRYHVDLDKGALMEGIPYVVEVGQPGAVEPANAVTFVTLQAASPGVAEVGHVNITGNLYARKIGAGLTNATARIHGLENAGTVTAVKGHNQSNTGNGYGGHFISSSFTGTGLLAEHLKTTGAGFGAKLRTYSSEGVGVYGWASSGEGSGIGGLFRSEGAAGIGVKATSDDPSGRAALFEKTNGGDNVRLTGGTNALRIVTDGAFVQAIRANVSGDSGWGAIFQAITGHGVYADTDSASYRAVQAFNKATGGTAVQGSASGDGSFGVYANGNLGASGTKSMHIDHPLDPENYSLTQYCTEGDMPYLTYRGTVRLDNQGEAWVNLPNYFEAINKDVSYHLTPIGSPTVPYVARKVQQNRFQIAGGNPGQEVSWMVMGVRNDAFVRKNGMAQEKAKRPHERGKFIDPDSHGQPRNRGINAASEARASRE